jgi:HAE1 family hydrophobic/amphiphilic exporter-1
MDSTSGTFRVVCAFDNAPELRPGMFGRIEVVYDQRTDALTVPRVALLEDEGEPAVYVIQGNKAKRTTVQLGYTNGEIAEIRSGLKEGDQVVTAGKVADPRRHRGAGDRRAGGAARALASAAGAGNADMSLVEFATRRRVTVAMVTLTFVLFGFIALGNLKVNLLPDLSYPDADGAHRVHRRAPAEIETLITEPVEEAAGVVKNLRKLKSVSRTGQSDVVLEFAWGTDMDQASLEVRDKLDVLRLPLEAKAPVLLRFNPEHRAGDAPGAHRPDKLSGSEQAELMRLRRYADNELKKKLEPVDGVAAIKVAGGLEDEVQVYVDADKLAQLNLPSSLVSDRLRQENVNISGGRIEEGSERYLVRTVNQFSNLDQMRELW